MAKQRATSVSTIATSLAKLGCQVVIEFPNGVVLRASRGSDESAAPDFLAASTPVRRVFPRHREEEVAPIRYVPTGRKRQVKKDGLPEA